MRKTLALAACFVGSVAMAGGITDQTYYGDKYSEPVIPAEHDRPCITRWGQELPIPACEDRTDNDAPRIERERPEPPAPIPCECKPDHPKPDKKPDPDSKPRKDHKKDEKGKGHGKPHGKSDRREERTHG